MATLLRIPSRFEALKEAVGATRIANVLVEPTKDLDAIKFTLAEVSSSGQGKLLFLLGGTGSGKTSLAESLPVFLPNAIEKVVTPPPDYVVPLGELPAWIEKNVPPHMSTEDVRTTIVNLDGREIPATDESQTSAAMVNLNALLRRPTHLDEIGNGNASDCRVTHQRHHGVAMAAEHEGVDVLDRDLEFIGEEMLEAGRVENTGHADELVGGNAGEFLQRPDHHIERVGDADDEGIRRVRLEAFADRLHDLEVDADEVIAAHAGLAGNASGDDAYIST